MKPIERRSVLSTLQEKAPRALHIAELCSRMDIAKHRIVEVQQILDALVTEGAVTEMPGRRYRLTKKKRERANRRERTERSERSRPERGRPDNRFGGNYASPILEIGRIQRNPRGFAFVAPESGREDIFIPPDALGASMHGDRVEVLARPSRKGREGRVTAVLERGSPRFSGTLRRHRGHAWIEPDDIRLPHRVEVTNLRDDVEGLAVVARFVQFPQGDGEVPSAEIISVLGVQGMTAVEVQKIKIREGVVEEFGDEALAEAEQLPMEVPASDFEGRNDLRHLDLTTIDPADARDHDDALYCELEGNGYRLVVAIADVAHYVVEGTAIDDEAISRMTSIYLPDRAIPMLPHQISSGLASLVPDEDRLCMAVDMHIDGNGHVRSYTLSEACMRSRARITYEGAAQALGLTENGPDEPEAKKRRQGLGHLYELSKVLRKKRLRRGALDFDLPEARVVLDVHNVDPVDVKQSRKDPGIREAYRIVEEMMLLANEVIAGELKKRGVPAIHRIHAPPDDKKIEKFAKLAGALAYDIDVEAAQDPKRLSRFLTKIDGTEHAHVLRYLLLRSMQQAAYDTNEDVGHFGLGARDYLHFTSPIRRYPDLMVHRVLKAMLRKLPTDNATLVPQLRRFSAEASRLERRAITVERDVVDLYRAILLRDRVGDEFDAEISGISNHGFYARFQSPFAEALVPIERLDDDYYEIGELGIRLIGGRTGRTFALGDRIRVRLEDVNVERREVVAMPVEYAVRADGVRRVGEENHDGRRPPKRRTRRDDDNGKRGRSGKGGNSRRGGEEKRLGTSHRGKKKDGDRQGPDGRKSRSKTRSKNRSQSKKKSRNKRRG